MIFTIDENMYFRVHEENECPKNETLISDNVRKMEFVKGYEFFYLGKWTDVCDVVTNLINYKEVING